MPLPTFQDEADFRSNFVGPFLTKLGFLMVTHTHGPGEQGKDFIFADYDRFESIRFYGAQVKIGDIGAGEIELDKLLNQIKRSFNVRIRYIKEAGERRVSSVYIITNGSISDQAREYITDTCHREHYGENVFYFDGRRLELMVKSLVYRSAQNYRECLLALALESAWNLGALIPLTDNLCQAQPNLMPIRLREKALSRFLESPLPIDILPYGNVSNAWMAVTKVNLVVEGHSTVLMEGRVIAPSFSDSALSIMVSAHKELNSLHQSIISALDGIEQHSLIEVEVPSDD